MYRTIALALAVSSLYLGNVIAAPAALPPTARDTAPSQVASLPPTSSTPNAIPSTITPLAGEKRAVLAGDSIHDLENFIFPQAIRPSPTSSAPSSTFVFEIGGPKATGKPAVPANVAPANVAARGFGRPDLPTYEEGAAFGPLDD
ncbi:MAG: hypothetical protein LQ348_000997 [Seirophora lacunosa]|nr:MAG: hypothetical protein LQ344_000154 [Seirophora lacunosa]KAI4206368.1 MAG: hypothetical protein LQ348_000997 [Seirophora lacunosa]